MVGDIKCCKTIKHEGKGVTMEKVLLVEDDKLQAKVTKEYLESKGFEVIWTDSGKEAIKIAKTQPVELILLDIILPDMDGNSVCRFFKHIESTKSIPLIALTIKGSVADRISGLDAGADDYLPKPFSEEELLARIYANLRRKGFQDEVQRMNNQLVEVLSKVEVFASTDTLTELFNRRYFENILKKEFNITSRYQTPTSCLMIDIDKFKEVNDQYGHQAGDTCLKEIANIIRNCVRNVDTVGRWGGEEFVVLLPQTNKENAMPPASRILKTIAKNTFSSYPDRITVSIGIASIPEPSIDSVEKLINAADHAMYEAKVTGGNKIELA
jgi:diguanylate cyclase (GGDEF)-like protein